VNIDFDPFNGDDPWDRALAVAAAFVGVLIAGTIAYRLLGLAWFDAFYQTLITVSTVGYGEVGEDITPTYRLVSSVLILVGVGIGVYSIGQVYGALMEGRLTDHVGRSRMRKEIGRLQDHIVICGWGQVGQAICATLQAEGESVVVIDRKDSIAQRPKALVVIGEATDDQVLLAAGVDRARSLIVALDGESDNLYVTLSGRAMNPGLFIVTRAVGPSSGSKLLQAGANRVVNPHEIGAERMSSFVLHPNVADFLGETMSDRRYEVRLGEIVVTGDAARVLTGCTVTASGILATSGVTLLAVRRPDGSFDHRHDGDFQPQHGDVLIVLGTAEQHAATRAWLAERSDLDATR
jgi:voltage-gated potassium channel